MHNVVISKIRCHNPNTKKYAPISNVNAIIYYATRDGVDLTELEEEKMSDNDLYLKYINERPRSHGLFGNFECKDLDKVVDEIKQRSYNKEAIFRGIVSLSEDDAIELGYLDKEKWKTLLDAKMPDIAAQFRISIENLRWVAAFHMEKGHPHVHYMFWDASNSIRSPYIPVVWQDKCRMAFSEYIFEEERHRLALEKSIQRDLILEFGKNIFNQSAQLPIFESKNSDIKIMEHISDSDINKISAMLYEMLNDLPDKGRLAYKLLEPNIKIKVDRIVDTILEIPAVKVEFEKYKDLMKQQFMTYSPNEKFLEYKLDKEVSHEMKKRIANQVLKTCKKILYKEKNIIQRMKHNKEWELKQEEWKKNYRKTQCVKSSYKLLRAAAQGFMQEQGYQQRQNEHFAGNDMQKKAELKRKIKSTNEQDKEI